jgi:hypothetical protein
MLLVIAARNLWAVSALISPDLAKFRMIPRKVATATPAPSFAALRLFWVIALDAGRVAMCFILYLSKEKSPRPDHYCDRAGVALEERYDKPVLFCDKQTIQMHDRDC